MKQTFVFFLIIGFLPVFTVLNLGKFLDVTDEPSRADVVVCMGGGTVERLKRSIELIEKGYVKTNRLLLVGESWYNLPFLKKNYPGLDVKVDERPKNTVEEIAMIKQYMHSGQMRSALIVTDPPHSRRVKQLASILDAEEEGREWYYVSSNVSWWNQEYYYDNPKAAGFAYHEAIKVFYNFLYYRIGIGL